MLDEKQIIGGCRKSKRKAQKALYVKYSPLMRAISLRYSHDVTEAEDILHEGFIKIYSNIDQYSGKGSFEGWMKKIIVNTALTYLRNNKKFRGLYNIDDINELNIEKGNKESNAVPTDVRSAITNADFTREEISGVIDSLPRGYKMVFSLYAIEGFKHREIATLLEIDESTSKSQLARARKLIQKLLYNLLKKKYKHVS